MYILMWAFMILSFSPTVSKKTMEAFCEDQIQVELFGHPVAPVFSAVSLWGTLLEWDRALSCLPFLSLIFSF